MTDQINENLSQTEEQFKTFNEELEKSVSDMEKIKEPEKRLSPEEIDKLAEGKILYDDITQIFKDLGVENPEFFTRGRIKPEALAQYPFSFQRMTLNRVLRLLFSEIEEKDGTDTRVMRFLLLEEGTYEQWLDEVKEVCKYIATKLELIPTKSSEEEEEVIEVEETKEETPKTEKEPEESPITPQDVDFEAASYEHDHASDTDD